MYIKTNDNFKKILGKDYLNKIKNVESLFSSQLAKVTVKEIDECYFLAFVAPPSSGFIPVDQVGIECFENRIYIEDYIDRKLDKVSYLLQGGKFGLCLVEKLSKFYPHDSFKIIVSCAKSGRDTKVTFHKIRKGKIYLTRNLNDYKVNGLMVMYT